jgi:hypothetical protein
MPTDPLPPPDAWGLLPGVPLAHHCPVCGLRAEVTVPAGSPPSRLEHCPACGCSPAGGGDGGAPEGG